MTYALPILVVACLCLGCVPASTPTPLPPDTHPSTDTPDTQAPDTNPNPQTPDTSPNPQTPDTSPPTPTPKTPPIPPLADALRHSAAATLIHGHQRASLRIYDQGIDTRSHFHAPPGQRIPPAHVLEMLDDLSFAEEVLRAGTITEVKSIEVDHILFKATMQLAPEHAAHFGRKTIRVAFKPAYLGVYGREWKRELLFYKLGKHLGLQSLVPLVERYVSTDPFLASMNTQLVPDQKTKMLYHNAPAHRTHMRGTVQLWVEGFMPVFGYRSSDNVYITEIGTSLDFAGRRDILADPLWQAISDMIVIDLLVHNSDRAREGGTIKLPYGGQRLVLLDNGDALLVDEPESIPRFCQQHFAATRAFSPNIYEKLKTLDEDTLNQMWVDMDGRPLTSIFHIRRVVSRAQTVVAHIDALAKTRAGLKDVLFPHDSAPMRSTPRSKP